MPRISKKSSISLSLVMTVLFFSVIVAGAILMPSLVKTLIAISPNAAQIGNIEHIFILVVAYLVLAVAAVADLFLFLLLLRVRDGEVFTGRSVVLIRGVAWCCVLFGVLFAALGHYFHIAFALGFAVIFLGVCLRVVKNVVEEAVDIKQENDLTV